MVRDLSLEGDSWLPLFWIKERQKTWASLAYAYLQADTEVQAACSQQSKKKDEQRAGSGALSLQASEPFLITMAQLIFSYY